MVIITSLLTFYIWHHAETVRMGYKTGDLKAKVAVLKKEVEELEAKKTSLLSLERVEKIAKEELNLQESREDQIIYDENKTPLLSKQK